MLSLTSYPVAIDSGIIKNTFAGFDDVEIFFKREDLSINSITQGTDNYILVKVTGERAFVVLRNLYHHNV